MTNEASPSEASPALDADGFWRAMLRFLVTFALLLAAALGLAWLGMAR